ncbi:176_t:CDS:1, partial [Funneliformis geosporum]
LVPQSNKAPAKKISFHYDKMSHDDWTKFANKANALLSSYQLANLDKPN